MQSFLRGLIVDLTRRCEIVRDRVARHQEGECAAIALDAYVTAEAIRRESEATLSSPFLDSSDLLSTHLQLFRRWSEQITLVESYQLPVVERYNENDHRLTTICRRMAKEIGWSLTAPTVVSFSDQYYWTPGNVSLIYVPAGEDTSLLGLPDLCHELGHILIRSFRAALLNDLPYEILSEFVTERDAALILQRPPHLIEPYEALMSQWSLSWLEEFVCDVIGAYLSGAAFAAQHIRLCARTSQSPYAPSFGEVSTHPADSARYQVMSKTLLLDGATDIQYLDDMWSSLVEASGYIEPPEFGLAYPEGVLSGLVQTVTDGCCSIGLRNHIETSREGGVVSALNEAWTNFLDDPMTFADWERNRLVELLRDEH